MSSSPINLARPSDVWELPHSQRRGALARGGRAQRWGPGRRRLVSPRPDRSRQAARRSVPASSPSSELINSFRAQNGVPPLLVGPALTRAAQAHSADMARRGYFDHGAFVTRLRRFGVRAPYVGENIAAGSRPLTPASDRPHVDQEPAAPREPARPRLPAHRRRAWPALDPARHRRLLGLAGSVVDEQLPERGEPLAPPLLERPRVRCGRADRRSAVRAPAGRTASSRSRRRRARAHAPGRGARRAPSGTRPGSSPCAPPRAASPKTSQPSMPGIITSSRITSGVSRRAISSPVTPSSASCTTIPAASRLTRQRRRIGPSSSITSTRAAMPVLYPALALRSRLGEWQLEREARASALGRVDPDATAHGQHEAARDEEPEPGPAVAAACCPRGGTSRRCARRSASGMPSPWSTTRTSTRPARRCASTVTVPPPGENLTALSSRFLRIWPSFSRSAGAASGSSGRLEHEAVPVDGGSRPGRS